MRPRFLSVDSVSSFSCLLLPPREMSMYRGENAERNRTVTTYLERIFTSTPKKGQSTCLDLYDSDSSSVDIGTPAQRRS